MSGTLQPMAFCREQEKTGCAGQASSAVDTKGSGEGGPEGGERRLHKNPKVEIAGRRK